VNPDVDGLSYKVILDLVNATTQADTVWFTTKGQVAIPLRLRKLYNIEDGTRGILKRKPGERPMSEWWLEHKYEEKELEAADYARHGAR
jgi:hypothetical protein